MVKNKVFCTPISIHTTARVVTGQRVDEIAGTFDFNPHHRTGGDGAGAADHQLRIQISIHTTARVVTSLGFKIGNGINISIHTTARVVTGEALRLMKQGKNFNPHHRTGGDRMSPPSP